MLQFHPYNALSLGSLAVLLSFASPACCNSASNSTAFKFDVQTALHYMPSKTIGAIGFFVYFFISSFLLWRLVRNRDWWGLCLPIGTYCEAMGFLLRIFISQPSLRGSLSYYIAMYLFIVLAPSTFLAFNYITYGRLIGLCVAHKHSFMKPEHVGRSFVLSDIFTFLVQGTGGSMGIQAHTATVGREIFLIGLITQALSYVVYDCLVVMSHLSTHREAADTQGELRHVKPWWRVFTLLYISSVFIIVRSLYRVAETIQGQQGYLVTHEWCFLIFDSIPLAIATGVYIFFWPGDYMSAEDSTLAASPNLSRNLCGQAHFNPPSESTAHLEKSLV